VTRVYVLVESCEYIVGIPWRVRIVIENEGKSLYFRAHSRSYIEIPQSGKMYTSGVSGTAGLGQDGRKKTNRK
jgi:hypothetical protein